jgi:hypothetical protein
LPYGLAYFFFADSFAYAWCATLAVGLAFFVWGMAFLGAVISIFYAWCAALAVGLACILCSGCGFSFFAQYWYSWCNMVLQMFFGVMFFCREVRFA